MIVGTRKSRLQYSVAYQVNIAFEAWEVQDQILLSWLKSTISKEMLTIVIRSKHSWQLWDQFHAFLQTHTDVKSQQLRSELRATQFDQGSVSEFLLTFKT